MIISSIVSSLHGSASADFTRREVGQCGGVFHFDNTKTLRAIFVNWVFFYWMCFPCLNKVLIKTEVSGDCVKKRKLHYHSTLYYDTMIVEIGQCILL